MTDALHDALKRLHVDRGAPSSRSISNSIANSTHVSISHTTINSILKGETRPKWETLKPIIQHLDGDVNLFQKLWKESFERTDRRSASPHEAVPPAPNYSKPIKSSKTSGDVSIFVSYAHKDDDATHGRVRALAKGIAQTYESITGLQVGIFFDTESIRLGDLWRDRIMSGLDSSTVLLAIISPSYLRSRSCRQEVGSFMSFLNKERRSRLLMPILLFPRERIDRYFSDDELWTDITNLQYVDASELWSEPPGSQTWIEHTTKIAERAEEALAMIAERQEEDSTAHTSMDDETSSEESLTDGDGIFDTIAALEEELLPAASGLIDRYGDLMSMQTEILELATPKLQRATSFRQKLTLARDTAIKLTPLANESLTVAKEAREKIAQITPGVFTLLQLVHSNSTSEPEEARSVISSVTSTAKISLKATDTYESLERAIPAAKGYSKDLDKPLIILRKSLLVMIEARTHYQSWLDATERTYN